MSLLNFITHYLTLRFGDILTGQSVLKNLDFLMVSQFWNKSKLIEYQEEKLRELIVHSVKTVPYYHDLFKNTGIKIVDIQTLADLKKIPILTKATIKNEGIDRFTSSAVPKNKMITSSSSGSTGEPLFYFSTKDAYSMNLASNLRGWYWMDYKLGDKYVKISQNIRKDFLKRIQDKVSRNLYLASNPLIDSNFIYILKEIEKYKPKIIRCYPDPLLFLAIFKQNHPEFAYKPKAINTTGNTLYPETREEIEKAFGCKVFDSYRCEGNSTAFECPTHTCYHSAEEYGISEILDEHGNPISSGAGRLISTDLWNLANPFIRYDTQDYIEVVDTPCACGRKLLRFNKILGRDNDILTISSGQKFIVHNFTGFFQVNRPQINQSVSQFQVVQKKNGTIVFRLVVNNKFNNSVASYIRSYWENELQSKVIVEQVENIPLLSTGKRKFIIKE